MPDFGSDLDLAAQFLDIAFHHIHADAAAGNRGDFLRGREPGGKNKIEGFFAAQLGAGGDETFLHRLFVDAFRVDAASVILQLDDDVAALMVSVEMNGAGFGFAGGSALGRGFQAMIKGVAHHVDQGIANLLDDGAVEFGVFTADGKMDFFPKTVGEIARETFHFLEGLFDGNHAQRHGGVLQLLRDARQLDDIAVQRRTFDAEHAGRLDELALHNHEFAHHIHE